MARRKRILEDDDDSDSYNGSEAEDFPMDESADAREEREMFENPYQRKRRKRNGKEDALYGIFAEDIVEDAARGKQDLNKNRRSDWTKAPAFVSGAKKVDLEEKELDTEEEEKVAEEEEEKEEEYSSEGEGEGEGAEEYSDNDSDPSRRPSPRIREDDEEDSSTDIPSSSGIGSRNNTSIGLGFSKGGITTTTTETTISAATSSFNSSRGGIGSKPSLSQTVSSKLPSTFASQSRSTSFVRDTTPTVRPTAPLSHVEQAHFAKLSGSFGARMLQKMGWQAGQGLGATGEGIVTPIESKMRPEKRGIAYRGFKEKTEQSKMEARRRGEVVTDDEDPQIRKAKKKEREVKEKKADAWRKPRKAKTKIQHKTYEEILAEAGTESSTSAGLGQIIDATGAVPREVSSLADISINSWIPSFDSTRIPEVRHNLRLITESCKADLDGLAREGKLLEERKKLVVQEDMRLRKRIEDEAELIARLQQIQIVTTEIDAKAKELSADYDASLDQFSPLFYKLSSEFEPELNRYRLDEVAVGAITPLVRRMVASWQPMEHPREFVSTFRNWRPALRINVEDETPPETQVDIYGSKTVSSLPVQIQKPMTPFESLLWNVWLPRVRTAINNEWSAYTPQPALRLYEAWSTFLPPFIRDNMLDQLILPKVHKAIADWNPKQLNGKENKRASLQSIVFPWLPHVGLRLEDFVGDARRKVKSLLRHWVVEDDLPEGLEAWKDVFDASEWDSMLLKFIVPKLGATLRSDLRINPRNQSMEPILHVLQWAGILRPSILSQLFEKEFFPKWIEVLHLWLIQPKVSFEEVAQWYSFWKASFPENLQSVAGISGGFTRGLQLMNQAIELGPEAPSKLFKPDYRAEQAQRALSRSPSRNENGVAKNVSSRPSARTQEITFRSIVEEFTASHDLLLMPTGRAHEKSRMPLFRISPSMDGKGGLLVYILDDAVWAAPQGAGGPAEEYRAISLDDVVSRAKK
ncbi:GC-rich sequence DNA-binding factor-like protein-domain-containing protein [Lentinula aciculospora]|uniref:GC-rich sequence DNA-binding factor-like protein-domain-containing protein n=1 Tax=Lentinula aciculospora TaxID=153920 RepID=A0A9W9DKA2_9AGAR|nr:GC-rich sequence DNA-binding factor-like protein-domain-containing protein [Lentinula aciculospora]